MAGKRGQGSPGVTFLTPVTVFCAAQSMLNRYLQHKTDEKRGPRQKRPYLATECKDLNEADKWRQQILREVGKKVMEIQNAGLGEFR